MAQSPCTILIVDDSPEDQELYRRYLKRDSTYSYTILEASLGQQGLDLWQQHQPDLVLLDYRLPDLDGLEFLTALQALSQQSCLPVIIVTGQGNEAIAVQAMKAGAQDYLLKGKITPETLQRAVTSAIETVQLRTQLQQRIERERLVAQITLQIHQSLGIDEILQTTVTEIRRFLQTDRVLVFQLVPPSNNVVVAESVTEAWRSVLFSHIHDPCFDENHIEQYRQGRVVTKTDIYDGSLTECHVEFLAQFQVRANLVVPILRDGLLWGLLIAHHCTAPRSWQALEVELLQQLALHLGIALQQANAYAQLQRQSEARYRAIVEDQTDLIIRYLPDTTVQFANGAFLRYFDLTLEEILGKSYEAVIFADDRERVAQVINSMNAQNPTITVENRVIARGEVRWTQWISRMLFDEQGTFTEFQAVGRDITQIKEAEAQLRHGIEQTALANAELARAAQLKDEFLANMSHELRTPLNSILGLSEVLLEEIFGSLSDRQRKFLQTIEQSGKHLLALINDILDLSKIESGKVEIELSSVALPTICESSLNFVRQQAQQKQIQLTCEIDNNLPTMQADERRIAQVLINLLTNAVKFTPDGGHVKLAVRLNPSLPAIEFCVTDSGIGIPPEHLNQIFQPFVQVDSSLSRRYAGTGLGLSIIKRIVDLHGGSIQVESEVGRGSCFTVALPWYPTSNPTTPQLPKFKLSQDENQPIPTTETSTATLPSPRLLLAEDNEDNIMTLLTYLEASNFQVMLAHNGLEAVQMAKQHQPDLILMDIQMPEMDGLEAIRQIRADTQTSAIPIIALTALAMPGDAERCLDEGANDYLSKPVKLKQLVERISQQLPQRSS